MVYKKLGRVIAFATPIIFVIASAHCQENNYVPLQIAAVESLACEQVKVANSTKQVAITGPMQNLRLLKHRFYIPFISIIENLKEYKESAEGRAYVPKDALKISIGDKKLYGIWENEVGIMFSPDPKVLADDDHGPRKLMKNINKRGPKDKKNIMPALKLLLLIDKRGNVALGNLQAFLPNNS